MFDQQNGVVNEALKSMGLLNEGLYWLKDGYLARIVVMIMCTWKYMGTIWCCFWQELPVFPRISMKPPELTAGNGDHFFSGSPCR